MGVTGTCLATLLVGLLFPARHARAGETETLAELRFQQGRSLLSAGQTEAACEKFEESNRLDPATGTLLNLAVCNEARGRTATAWTQFRIAETASRREKRADRVALAEQHLTALAPQLTRLTIKVPPESLRPGLEIRLDGVDIGQAAWNVAAPIDPGPHMVLASAAGTTPRHIPLAIGKQADSVSLVIFFAPLPGAPAAQASPRSADAQPLGGGEGSPPGGGGRDDIGDTSRGNGAVAESPGSERSRTYRRAAIVAGGLGVAALVAGSIMGLQAFSRWDERNGLCPMDLCSTDAGRQAQRGAESAARNADVAVTVGLLALAGGGTLYWLSRRETGPAGDVSRSAHAQADSASSRAWRLDPLVSTAVAGLRIGRAW